jgi:hypothetical protein
MSAAARFFALAPDGTHVAVFQAPVSTENERLHATFLLNYFR